MKPYLNLGCGRTHLPGERPAHHAFVPEEIYSYTDWVNVDRSANVGADKVFDLFKYPWPLESDAYDGALLSHLCEHIPHEIKIAAAAGHWLNGIPDYVINWHTREWSKGGAMPGIVMPDYDDFEEYSLYLDRVKELKQLQDGWFAFFAELYRVLSNGAQVHILSPHASSDGADVDPTHIRRLTPASFAHSMRPDPNAPFEYSTGGVHFEMNGSPLYEIGELYHYLLPREGESEAVAHWAQTSLYRAMNTQRNAIVNFYVRLTVVK